MTRAGRLAVEAVRIAISQPVATAITALVVAAVCGVVMATTGQTAALERDVLRRIDEAGTRTIVIDDVGGDAALDAGAVDRVGALDQVEWVIGLGRTTDVRPLGLPGAAAVPFRPVFGELPAVVTTSGWPRAPATAIAGPDALRQLGLQSASGPVIGDPQDGGIAVVGWLDADSPLDFLDRSVVGVPDERDRVVRVFVVAGSAGEVPAVAEAIGHLLDPADASSLSVATSDALVQIQAAVQGELGAFGRGIVLGALGSGLALITLNVLGAVTARQRDFGRRRALGASRLDILGLVTIQTIVPALLGAVLGTGIGTLTVYLLVDAIPDPAFILAVGILAVLVSVVAALPPAVLAANRDPVRVLRVP